MGKNISTREGCGLSPQDLNEESGPYKGMYVMKDYMNFMRKETCMLFHLPDGFLVSPEMIHLMILHGWRITPSSREGWSIMVRVPTLKRDDRSSSSIEDVPCPATNATNANANATAATGLPLGTPSACQYESPCERGSSAGSWNIGVTDSSA